MSENTKKSAFDYLDDLEYVHKAAVFNVFGKSWIDNKRCSEILVKARESVEEALERARKIEVREEKIYEEAEKKKEQKLQEVQEQINNMNIVKEAEAYASQVVEAAEAEAAKIKKEAKEIVDGTIAHGEEVKNQLINQGHQFVWDLVYQALKSYEEHQEKLIESMRIPHEQMMSAYEKNLNSLLESIQGPRESLIAAFEEMSHLAKKEDEELAS